MYSIKSKHNSLLDLSINELSTVAWHCMDLTEFADELKNETLIKRMRLMDDKHFSNMNRHLEDDNSVCRHSEENRKLMFQFCIDVIGDESKVTDQLSWYFFAETKHTQEFMEKYALKRSYNARYFAIQDWLTPELYEKYCEYFSSDEFFQRFVSLDTEIGGLDFSGWYNYQDGKYRNFLSENSNVFKYSPVSKFKEHGFDVPAFYNTVLTPQRIMAGDPCRPGQRSFAIWLKKYRRMTGDSTGYPTWGALMDVYEKHPRMDNNGYIEWIWMNSLFLDDNDINRASESLTIDGFSRDDFIEMTQDETTIDETVQFITVAELLPGLVPIDDQEDLEMEPDEEMVMEMDSGEPLQPQTTINPPSVSVWIIDEAVVSQPVHPSFISNIPILQMDAPWYPPSQAFSRQFRELPENVVGLSAYLPPIALMEGELPANDESTDEDPDSPF